ncbi:MAG: ISL3 family transposase [Thermodesulfobacteriota bacterium]
MRDTELYQTLLGLTPPWEVTAVQITQPAAERALGEIAVTVQWRADTPLSCPACGGTASRYDSRPRRWRHLNTMQWKTFIAADVPRVNCPKCGVKQVRVAWAEDASRFTELFEAFAIQVLKAVRSKVQAQWLTHLTWDQVDRLMERSVSRGLKRRSLEGLTYVGLDEKSFGKGHDYVSVLHDIPGKRVLDVVPERTREAADSLWATVPETQREGIRACAMDMWENYLEATRAAAPKAAIVHDKFHCAKELNKAVDLVRRKEHRELKAKGEETLTKTRYLWLKNPNHFTERQRTRFDSLKLDTLKVGRAWAIKEAFAELWRYRYVGSARKFFDRWYFWATHSRLPPIIEAAKTLKRHLPGLLAYTKHRITNAVAEGTNGRIQLLKANARGYRNFAQYRIAILFHCGGLDLYPADCAP